MNSDEPTRLAQLQHISSRWLLFNIGFLKLWMEKEVETDHLWFKEGCCIIMQPTISSNMEK